MPGGERRQVARHQSQVVRPDDQDQPAPRSEPLGLLLDPVRQLVVAQPGAAVHQGRTPALVTQVTHERQPVGLIRHAEHLNLTG